MLVIEGRNVESVMHSALIFFRDWGQESTSRVGRVIELPQPVTSVYRRPMERVVFSPARDCNPFLHFFESLWMLSGSNQLSFVSQFSSNMKNFSDDGETLNGAYGHRWRQHFAHDQLMEVIRLLRETPNTRRAVLSMWDGWVDLRNQVSKDLPCNTEVLFRNVGGQLDMTVVNRSNDALWGAYGANAVHFSFLHEIVALGAGLTMGVYRQVSNNLHIYPDTDVGKRMLAEAGTDVVDRYRHGEVHSAALGVGLATVEDLLSDFELCVSLHPMPALWEPKTVFYREVAAPLARSWKNVQLARHLRKIGADQVDVRDAYSEAIQHAATCHSIDWSRAAVEWINRRVSKFIAGFEGDNT